jgi:hypothetical protein
MFEVICITFAYAFGMVVKRIGLPPLVGFLAAGFAINALSPSLNLPTETGDIIGHIAHLGVLLLLFTVGLKLRLGQLVQPQVLGERMPSDDVGDRRDARVVDDERPHPLTVECGEQHLQTRGLVRRDDDGGDEPRALRGGTRRRRRERSQVGDQPALAPGCPQPHGKGEHAPGEPHRTGPSRDDEAAERPREAPDPGETGRGEPVKPLALQTLELEPALLGDAVPLRGLVGPRPSAGGPARRVLDAHVPLVARA